LFAATAELCGENAMRNLAALAALLASCAIALAQDTPALGPNSPAPSNRSAAKKPPAFDTKGTPVAAPVESATSRRKREEAVFYRRNDVVMKLREIATLTGDAELTRQADDLQGKVWDAYLLKISQIPSDYLPEGAASAANASTKTPALASAASREAKQ
jgi:hypothetical protein